MGMSADAIVFYGVVIAKENEFTEEFDFLNEEIGEDPSEDAIQDWLIGLTGAKVNEQTYEQRRDTLEAMPLEVVTFQHHEVTSYALAVKGTVQTACVGRVVELYAEHSLPFDNTAEWLLDNDRDHIAEIWRPERYLVSYYG